MSRTVRTKSSCPPSQSSMGRRHFLGRVAGASAIALATTTIAPRSVALGSDFGQRGIKSSGRIDQAYEMRERAALYNKHLPSLIQLTNGDENLYADKVASYTKGLPHDELGRVDPAAYQSLVNALSAAGAVNFDSVPIGGDTKLSNPQAGLCFELEGADSHRFALAPPPKFASSEEAGEMAELYWQALTRDVPFSRYDADPLTSAAVTDLSRLSDFRGPKDSGHVKPEMLFRGTTPGDLAGPYVSQFLWHDVPYGVTPIVQRINTATPGVDYVSGFDNWLAIQNGAMSVKNGRDPTLRFIRNSRDLARYVHQDFTCQAFLNACLILLGANAPFDESNPYKRSTTQSGFSTFGAPHALDLLGKVVNCGLKAAWYQKWYCIGVCGRKSSVAP